MTGKTIVSLFSGIGGFELAFGAAGYGVELMCDVDESAQRVLKRQFHDVRIASDVTILSKLPRSEVLAAGWPCQDLSQAGKMAGLGGSQSGLVREIFRLLDATNEKPKVVVLENVAFALSLGGGAAIKFVTQELSQRGYRWAYRILDTNAFGLPQRRRRIFVVGALDASPEAILFDGLEQMRDRSTDPAHVGFYWTEGNRGVGWTPDAIPPLKGGSAFSIPSPPAIWSVSDGRFFTPGIEDAERLQGFLSGWTDATGHEGDSRKRWRLVGNAVSVPVATWLAHRVAERHTLDDFIDPSSTVKHGVHNAAWGGPKAETRYLRNVAEGPSSPVRGLLGDFGLRQTKPLSLRAARGFLSRYAKSTLSKNPAFAASLEQYCYGSA